MASDMSWLMTIALVGCGHIGIDPRLTDIEDDGGLADVLPDAVPGAPGWVLVQTEAVQGPTLTVDPLGSQHLIVMAVQLDQDGLVTAITDNSNCNSYMSISTAHAGCAELETELVMYYANPSCTGATTISVAATTSVLAAVVWEVSGIRTDDPLDTAIVLDDQPASTSPLGPTITTSTDGEFVVSVAIVDNIASGIHPGNEFTNDQFAFGNGWAHLTDPMAKAGVHQAQWDQPDPGVYCANAAAFKIVP